MTNVIALIKIHGSVEILRKLIMRLSKLKVGVGMNTVIL